MTCECFRKMSRIHWASGHLCEIQDSVLIQGDPGQLRRHLPTPRHNNLCEVGVNPPTPKTSITLGGCPNMYTVLHGVASHRGRARVTFYAMLNLARAPDVAGVRFGACDLAPLPQMLVDHSCVRVATARQGGPELPVCNRIISRLLSFRLRGLGFLFYYWR